MSNGGGAVGFSLVIDENLINRMMKADSLITDLATKSEQARTRIISAFRDMGDNGVGHFIKRLQEAQEKLNNLSVKDVKLNVTGLENISVQATKGADDVNKLYSVISQLAEVNAKLVGSIGASNNSLKDFFSTFKGASDDIDKLAKAEETLIKQNEILSRMQTATLNKKMQDVDYQKGINQVKELAAIETARKNQIAETNLQESNAHKQKMGMLQAETKEIQAQTIAEKDAANQKINAAKESTIATMQQANAIKESINAERQNARNISLANKQAAADMRVQSEQIKTQSMEQIKAEKEKQAELKRTIAEVNRLAKAYKAMPTIMTGVGLNKLLTESSNAISINQRIVAIQNLKNSIKDLDTTDVNYGNNLRNINSEISRLTKELRQLGVSTNEAAKSHRNLMDISGQLARKLALVFSVSQIQGYMNKLVSVRGEFELQQRSMQVLLQNRDEANKLWQQTVELAVKSPFRVSELVSYTRQLAAYRIETDKLHETTRKLADVSAGLGVDMNRLILAYGQVRAAEYLRGCLGYGTPIKKANGDIVEVQDIKVGDKLLNENNEIVNVLELIRGREQMYVVRQENGIEYRVNENHILTLEKNGTLHDVYIKDWDISYLGVRSVDGRLETTKISICKDKVDDYFGFVLDGNKRFQLGDGTITHNTELRQFTEAGIPMLDELAKRFTELEGRTVRAGDVFERISKRMVSFEDVAAVFDKMTSAGGTFYRMQEEQSNTLKGMISNLHDSIDLMLNDIGKSNEGVLKGSVNAARVIVEQWEAVAVTLKTLIALFAFYRIGMLTTSQKMIKSAESAGLVNAELTSQIKLVQIAQTGWLKLGAAMKGAWVATKATLPLAAVTAFFAGVAKLVSVIREHEEQIEEITKKYGKLRDRMTEISFAFNNAVDEKDIQTQKQKLESLIELANNEYHMNIKVNLVGATEDDIQKKFVEIQNRLTELNSYAQLFETIITKSTEWKATDIFDKVKDMSSEISKTFALLSANVASVSEGMRKYANELSESEKEAYELLKAPKQAGESDVEYFNRLVEGYSILIKDIKEMNKELYKYTIGTDEYDKFVAKYNAVFGRLKSFGLEFNTINDALSKLLSSQTNAQEEYNKTLKKSKGLFTALQNLPKDEKEVRLKFAIDKLSAEKDWNDFVTYYIYRWTEKPFDIKFSVVPTQKDSLVIWQENYNKRFDGYTGFHKIEDADYTREKAVQRINGLLKEQKDLVTRIRNAGTGVGTAYEGYDLAEETRKLKELQEQSNWFGEPEKNKGKGKDWFGELAKNIKDAHKEFISLNKDLDATAAKEMMLKKYEGVISESIKALGSRLGGLDIKKFDLTDEASTIEFLRKLLDKIPDSAKEAKLAVNKVLSDIVGEQAIEEAKGDTKKLIDEIKDMIDGYKFSIELENLGVPKDLAKDLFGIQTFDLDEIKQRIDDEKSADKQISQERLNQLNDLLRQIADMEDKARIENLKKYTKYLVAAQSEAVKIKLEEAKKIAEIESLSEMSPSQKEIAKSAVREETQKKVDKQQWEDFKNTDMYIELFEDLDAVSTNTLNRMKSKLIYMRDSLKELDPSQLKEISKRINEVNKALVSNNPFKGILSSLGKVIFGYRAYRKAEEDALIAQQSVDNQQKKVDELQIVVERLRKSNDGNLSTKEQELLIETRILKDKKETLKGLIEEKNSKKDILALSKEQLSEASKVLNQQLSSLDEIKNAWSSVFGSMSDELSDAFDTIQEIGGGISNVISGLAQGPAGYLQAVAGLMQVIGGIFNIGDKRREREIQDEIKNVEKLQRAYEKLEKAIDDAYSIDTLQRSTENAKSNLQAQINSYNSMIAAEEAKKNSDDERIKEWKDAIEDLREQIDELNEQAFSKATDGIIDNVLDASKEFTDAWLEAFQSTGDGLSGLKDNFNETIQTMLKQQAAMLITSKFAESWKKQLERYINADDLELSAAEAKKWVEDVQQSMPKLSDALNNYFNSMKAAGIDIGTGDSMSGLQKGIQGITESQADILAAYWNSCRFLMSNIDNTLTSLASHVMGGSEIENPMVAQLKIIAQQTTAINALLQGCTKGGHRLGGMGIKIFMD